MFFVYILRSLKNNSYYIGSTKDLDQRLKKHNQGLIKSTKSRLPFEIIYYEKFNTLSEARKRELQIKNWKKRNAIERLIKKSVAIVADSRFKKSESSIHDLPRSSSG